MLENRKDVTTRQALEAVHTINPSLFLTVGVGKCINSHSDETIGKKGGIKKPTEGNYIIISQC